MKRKLILMCALACAACGQSSSVIPHRLIYTPAKPSNCDLKVLNMPVHEAQAPTSEWELVASLIVSYRGGDKNPDPFAPEQLAAIRPDACGLGGEALILTSESPGVVHYAVLAKRKTTE